MTIDRSFFRLTPRVSHPEMLRASTYDCPSLFAPASWSLDAVVAFGEMAQLSEGRSITETTGLIAELLTTRALGQGLLTDVLAGEAFKVVIQNSLISQEVGVSTTLLSQLAIINPSAVDTTEISPIPYAIARTQIARRKQAQFDGAALSAGRENLCDSLGRVGQAVTRSKGQGFDNPSENHVLAQAVAAAFRAGAPAGAVAETIDDARHGYFQSNVLGGYIDSPILTQMEILLDASSLGDGDLLLDAARTGCRFV